MKVDLRKWNQERKEWLFEFNAREVQRRLYLFLQQDYKEIKAYLSQ